MPGSSVRRAMWAPIGQGHVKAWGTQDGGCPRPGRGSPRCCRTQGSQQPKVSAKLPKAARSFYCADTPGSVTSETPRAALQAYKGSGCP